MEFAPERQPVHSAAHVGMLIDPDLAVSHRGRRTSEKFAVHHKARVFSYLIVKLSRCLVRFVC